MSYIAPGEVVEKVKHLILLEVAVGVLAHDKRALEHMPVKMRELYVEQYDRLEARAVREQSETRIWLRKNKVRNNWVWDKKPGEIGLEYWWNGYRQYASLLGSYCKAEVQKLLEGWARSG